jgi:hypothetical protein
MPPVSQSLFDPATLQGFVYEQTEKKRAFSRCWKLVSTKIPLNPLLSVIGLVFTVAISGFLGYTTKKSFEGSYYSLNETISSYKQTGEWTPDIGNVGGWTVLTLVTIGVVLLSYEKLIKQAEYQDIVETHVKDWYEKNPTVSASALYEQTQKTLAITGSQCLFSKTTLENKLNSLMILENLLPSLDEEHLIEDPQLKLDWQLKETYLDLQIALQRQLSFKNYIGRMFQGFRYLSTEEDKCSAISASILGLGGPVFLGILSGLSLMGTHLLIQELKNHLTHELKLETGHVAEWLQNGAELAILGYLLHRRFIKVGDLKCTIQSFEEVLKGEEREVYYNHLCQFFNQELQKLVSQTSASELKVPQFRKFDKLERVFDESMGNHQVSLNIEE